MSKTPTCKQCGFKASRYPEFPAWAEQLTDHIRKCHPQAWAELQAILGKGCGGR